MVKFNTKTWGEVAVRFSYDYPNYSYAIMTYKNEENEHVVVSVGFSKKCKADEWNKAEGRKIAFARVLADADLDRLERVAAWDCYWNICKD